MKYRMQDDQLIFLISMPRSGSTLLQKILGRHSEVCTRSEPWLMLHALYALKEEGIQARYNAQVAAAGVRDFISEMPDKDEEFYYKALRSCYLSLYQPYLEKSGKSRFLDKTPRYYEVFDELQRTFPGAKFIILYRNPLAVLASILKTWIRGNYSGLKEYRSDLYEGVRFLQRDFSSYANTYTIKYENLLLNPELEVAALFNFLDLPNQPNCINYGTNDSERWKYGDPVTVYEKDRPDEQHANAWHKQLGIADNRKLLFDYLQLLGKSGFERLGYNFEEALDSFPSLEQDTSHSEHELSLHVLLQSDSENAQRIHTANAELIKLEKDINKLKKQYTDAQHEHNQSIENYKRLLTINAELENGLAETKSERDRYLDDIRATTKAIERLENILYQGAGEAHTHNLRLNERVSNVGALLEKLSEYNKHKHAELETCNIQLRKAAIDLEVQKSKTVRLEKSLSILLQAAEKLTKRRAILHPIAKAQAYKELMDKFLVARKDLSHPK